VHVDTDDRSITIHLGDLLKAFAHSDEEAVSAAIDDRAIALKAKRTSTDRKKTFPAFIQDEARG